MSSNYIKRKKATREIGFTILELMVTVGIVSILSATAIYNLREVNSSIKNATFAVEQFIRLARANAISGTQMIQVAPISATVIGTSSGTSCSGPMTAITGGNLTMPTGSSLLETNWSVCFNQRGVTSASTLFHFKDTKGNTRTVRVALGGGTKVTTS